MEIWLFVFAKVVYEHTLGAVDSTYLILLEIYSGVTAANYRNLLTFD